MIFGGTISPTIAKVIYSLSPILSMNSQFPEFRLPVYMLDPVANISSALSTKYNEPVLQLGNADAG